MVECSSYIAIRRRKGLLPKVQLRRQRSHRLAEMLLYSMEARPMLLCARRRGWPWVTRFVDRRRSYSLLPHNGLRGQEGMFNPSRELICACLLTVEAS